MLSIIYILCFRNLKDPRDADDAVYELDGGKNSAVKGDNFIFSFMKLSSLKIS